MALHNIAAKARNEFDGQEYGAPQKVDISNVHPRDVQFLCDLLESEGLEILSVYKNHIEVTLKTYEE